MKELKRYLILGIIFVIFAGTFAHFVYDWSGQNRMLGLFFPVNESTWEHMKLIYFPMLIYAFYMRYRLSDSYACLKYALPIGILVGTFVIPVLYYTYTGILGKNYAPLDISVFVISVLIAFYTVYRQNLSCKAERYMSVLWFIVAALDICFMLFSYLPPDLALFRSS